MSTFRYENPFRPVFEVKPAAVWAFSALWTAGLGVAGLGGAAAFGVTAVQAGLAVYFGLQAKSRLDLLKNMGQRQQVIVLPRRELDPVVQKNQALWLGWGFDWTAEHAERAYMLRLADNRKRIGVTKSGRGAPWIHGLGDYEADIEIPLDDIRGHVGIFGTTGAGKTRLFEIMVTQAIARGDTVFIVDPKGDKDLIERARAECARMGRPERFNLFNPAAPQSSICINPLANWTRPSEIASRVAALMESESTGDPFTGFSWRAINLIAQGLIEMGHKPTLVSLRRYIEGDPGDLLRRAMESWFARRAPGWEMNIQPYVSSAQNDAANQKFAKNIINGDPILTGYVRYYRQDLNARGIEDDAISGLISLVEHNREHFGKMIAGLIPILNMLTSATLGPLLSPGPDEIDAGRVVTDSATLIRNRAVTIFALDSLSDRTIGSAIGSMVLADLAAVAGERYNAGDTKDRIWLFVDEASEVVNAPLVQILNKGRGAGFIAICAAQTMADYAARLGSENKARQVLGNMNSMIALRTVDAGTQRYIAESLESARLREVRRSMSGSTSSDKPVGEFSGGVTETLSDSEGDLFPQALLGMLPDFHYIARIAGGRVIKGRFTILERDEKPIH